MFGPKVHLLGVSGVLSPGKNLKFKGPKRAFGSKIEDFPLRLRRFQREQTENTEVLLFCQLNYGLRSSPI